MEVQFSTGKLPDCHRTSGSERRRSPSIPLSPHSVRGSFTFAGCDFRRHDLDVMDSFASRTIREIAQ